MNCITAHAEVAGSNPVDNARKAVALIRDHLGGGEVGVVLFFASPNHYDAGTLARAMQQAFPQARTFGCSSAGELEGGRLRSNSVVAMAFTPDAFETVEVAAIADVDSSPGAVDAVFGRLEAKNGLRMSELDFRAYFGLVLLDGMAKTVDRLVERMGELTDVIFAGGLAGDDANFKRTLVFCDGEVYTNGMVAALLKPKGRFALVKTQSIVPTGVSMVATKVDTERRIIYEFDGRPAAEVYAAAMGITIDRESFKPDDSRCAADIMADDLNSRIRNTVPKDQFIKKFLEWPLALMIHGEPFIRAAATVTGDGGILTYLPPIEGVRYSVTRITDVVAGTRKALEDRRRELGGISGIISVSCALRAVQIKHEGMEDEFGEIFAGIPTVGFSSYGEIYVSAISQTAVMVVFA